LYNCCDIYCSKGINGSNSVVDIGVSLVDTGVSLVSTEILFLKRHMPIIDYQIIMYGIKSVHIRTFIQEDRTS